MAASQPFGQVILAERTFSGNWCQHSTMGEAPDVVPQSQATIPYHTTPHSYVAGEPCSLAERSRNAHCVQAPAQQWASGCAGLVRAVLGCCNNHHHHHHHGSCGGSTMCTGYLQADRRTDGLRHTVQTDTRVRETRGRGSSSTRTRGEGASSEPGECRLWARTGLGHPAPTTSWPWPGRG